MRKITSLIMILVVVLVGLLPQAVASASSEGTTSGAFTISNSAPVVSAVEVYQADLTTTVSDLTPQVTYYAKVSASDANSLDDITQIKLKIFYDAAGNDPNESGFTVGTTNTTAIITWTKSSNVTAISAGAGTTWSLSANATLPTMTGSSGDWVFAFKVGKVAAESPGSDDWDIHARAYDSLTDSGAYQLDKNVLWYGEISVGTPSVDFGSVTPGTDFGSNNVTGISTTYIANGDYEERVKSSATWVGASNNATLDATGAATNPKEFSLKAWINTTLAGAPTVDTIGVIIDPTDFRTTETGDVHSANTLWLKLAPVFPIDLYSGTITYIIANR